MIPVLIRRYQIVMKRVNNRMKVIVEEDEEATTIKIPNKRKLAEIKEVEIT